MKKSNKIDIDDFIDSLAFLYHLEHFTEGDLMTAILLALPESIDNMKMTEILGQIEIRAEILHDTSDYSKT